MFVLYSHIYDLTYKHIVPTGLKRVLKTFFYKHIVPTGLKRVQRKRKTLKTFCLCEIIFYNSHLAQLVIIQFTINMYGHLAQLVIILSITINMIWTKRLYRVRNR